MASFVRWTNKFAVFRREKGVEEVLIYPSGNQYALNAPLKQEISK
jgi:hypothetical protein